LVLTVDGFWECMGLNQWLTADIFGEGATGLLYLDWRREEERTEGEKSEATEGVLEVRGIIWNHG